MVFRRKFKLINAKGLVFNLMDTNSFFHNPDGLGFEIEYEFLNIKDYQLETNSISVQKVVTGEMIFSDYQKYKEFACFISSKPLKIEYSTNDIDLYYIDCNVSKLSKTEVNHETGRLICDIDFVCTSKWYKKAKINKTSKSQDNSKTYSFKYPYKYLDNQSGTIEIINDSNELAPMVIHIFGPAKDVKWELVENGILIAEGAIKGDIAENQKLVINSKPSNEEIGLYSNDNKLIEDYYQKSVFSTKRFIMAPVGRSTLKIKSSTAATVYAYAEVIEHYETV